MAASHVFLFVLAVAAVDGQTGKTDGAEKASDPMSKVICKRFTETGSLVKGYRTCKTKREWEEERDAARSSASQSGACNTGGGGGIC